MTGPTLSERDRAYLAWGCILAVTVALGTLAAVWANPAAGVMLAAVWALCSVWLLSAVLRARRRRRSPRE